MALQSREEIEKYLLLYRNFGCISTFEVYTCTYIYIELEQIKSTLICRSTLNKAIYKGNVELCGASVSKQCTAALNSGSGEWKYTNATVSISQKALMVICCSYI